jgi:competence protein ComEA
VRRVFEKLLSYVEISNFERGGLMALLFSLLLVSAYYYYKNSRAAEPLYIDETALAAFRKQVDSTFAKEKEDYTYGDKPNAKVVMPVRLFNPNAGTASALQNKGVPRYIAQAIVKYRNAGGKFRYKSDLAKLYVIDEQRYYTLEPYIDLPVKPKRVVSDSKEEIFKKDSVVARRPIDINTVSASDLEKLSGIGSFYAQKITEYRDKLGGFVSSEQLNEVFGMRPESVDQISSYFEYGENIKQKHTNSAGFKDLVAHPYLTYNEVKAIVNYREQHDGFHSVSEIMTLHIFKGKDTSRLIPYLDLN